MKHLIEKIKNGTDTEEISDMKLSPESDNSRIDIEFNNCCHDIGEGCNDCCSSCGDGIDNCCECCDDCVNCRC